MRTIATIVLTCLLAMALGCGSPSSRIRSSSTTPSSVAVSMQPLQGASPIQVSATASSAYPIQQWQIAVDSATVWQQASSQPSIVQAIPVAPGQHQITTTAIDSTGTSGSSSAAVTITAGSGVSPTATSLSVMLGAMGSSSPLTITAAAMGPHPMTGWALYIDGNLAEKQNSSSGTFSDTVQMTTGKHQVIARVWDNTGAYAAATATANITNSSATTTTGSLIPAPPASARTWNHVEEKSGWSDCGACAGNTSGTGPVGTFWFKQGVTSPALDGKSMEAYIGGWVPWADAVYAYHFGPQNWANHMLYTVHFLWNASKTRSGDGAYVVQGVEFDSYFYTSGFKYMFGTQCDYAGGYWGIWNGPNNKWQNTSLKCNKFPPNSWHTITWYGERDQSTKKLHFLALAVDGKQSSIDGWMDAVGSSNVDDSGIQFQQDSDRYGSPWNAWIDQVSFTIW